MSDAITIRYAREGDRADLLRLAALDDRPAPGDPALLGFVDGELRAALPLGGEPVADPFHLTAHVVELLRLRAGQRADGGRARGEGARARGRALLGRLLPGVHGTSQEVRA